MKKTMVGLLFLLGLFGAVQLHRALAAATAPPPLPADPRRIVSLAPSVTETLYALGLGDRVAGVTQFCHYPPEVLEKPVVAGFSEVNFEAVLRQRPDLVALPVDKIRNKSQLEHLGLTVLPLNTRSLSGLLETVRSLGRSTGREARAELICDRLDGSVAQARARAAGRPRPRVLFSVMHSYEGLGYITEINAVGQDGFFSELIDIAGGRNVYQGSLAFPRLSREAIIYLNPDLIVDIIPFTENLEGVKEDWLSLTSVEAIKNGRLFFLTDEADTVPGPRIHQTLGKLSRAFHPDAAGAEHAED
ncbi:MAG: helical backbone metal receptor [Candidatus Adiutrix sp.]|nr:helical backbone metal receptor [Candidatus Adiutrix sp.]